MKRFLLGLIAASSATLSSCSSEPMTSTIKDAPLPAFEVAANLYSSGSLPNWADLNSTHVIIGSTTFASSPSTVLDLAGFFYVQPNTSTVYYNGIFYSGAVPTWSLADYINSVAPLINAGRLSPLHLSADGTSYDAGAPGLVVGSFRTAVDGQNFRYLIQSRLCIAAAGCDLPDGQGNRPHFNQGFVFGYAVYTLAN